MRHIRRRVTTQAALALSLALLIPARSAAQPIATDLERAPVKLVAVDPTPPPPPPPEPLVEWAPGRLDRTFGADMLTLSGSIFHDGSSPAVLVSFTGIPLAISVLNAYDPNPAASSTLVRALTLGLGALPRSILLGNEIGGRIPMHLLFVTAPHDLFTGGIGVALTSRIRRADLPVVLPSVVGVIAPEFGFMFAAPELSDTATPEQIAEWRRYASFYLRNTLPLRLVVFRPQPDGGAEIGIELQPSVWTHFPLRGESPFFAWSVGLGPTIEFIRGPS